MELVSQPIFWVGALGLLAMTFVFMAKFRLAVWGIIALLFTSSLLINIDWGDKSYTTWIMPLQVWRSELYAGLGVVLSAAVVANLHRVRGVRVAGATWVLLLIGLYAGAIRLVHTDPLDSMISAGTALLTIPAVALITRANLQEHEDVLRLLRAMLLAAGIWVFIVVVQFFVNSRSIYLGTGWGRFVGVGGNPQNAAIFLAPMIAVGLWLVLNGSRKVLRIAAFATVGLMLVMLIWTGSRTGAAMLVILVSFVLYGRVGRAVIFLPVLLLLAYGLVTAVQLLGVDLSLDRFSSLEDTRSYVWSSMVHAGMESPLVGIGADEAEASENSFLYGFASYGAGMLILILLFTAMSGALWMRLWRARRWLSLPERRVSELVLGYITAFFAGSVFEGYIIARVAANLVLFTAMSAIAVYLVQVASARRDVPELEPFDDATEYELAYGELA